MKIGVNRFNHVKLKIQLISKICISVFSFATNL